MQVKANLLGDVNCHRTLLLLQMLNKEIFDIKNEGQSDGAQHPPWRHSMSNIIIYTRHCTFFVLAFTIFEILASQIVYLEYLA